jgi:hypothetical protein
MKAKQTSLKVIHSFPVLFSDKALLLLFYFISLIKSIFAFNNKIIIINLAPEADYLSLPNILQGNIKFLIEWILSGKAIFLKSSRSTRPK